MRHELINLSRRWPAHQIRRPPTRDTITRVKRQYSIVIIGYALFMCGVCVSRGVGQFRLSSRPSFPTAWWEQFAMALFFAILAVATIVYEARRDSRQDVDPLCIQRWRDRIELRTVLYALASLLILVLPSA